MFPTAWLSVSPSDGGRQTQSDRLRSLAMHCGQAADAHGRGATPVYLYCSSPVLRLSEPEWQLELLLSDKHSQHALLCLILR